MKIHTDKLTYSDIHQAVPTGCYLVEVHSERAGGYFTIVPEPSRSHDHGYLVRMSGSHRSNMQRLPDKAATYDEWGIFIARLFMIDPNAKIGNYKGWEDFDRQTKGEFASVLVTGK